MHNSLQILSTFPDSPQAPQGPSRPYEMNSKATLPSVSHVYLHLSPFLSLLISASRSSSCCMFIFTSLSLCSFLAIGLSVFCPPTSLSSSLSLCPLYLILFLSLPLFISSISSVALRTSLPYYIYLSIHSSGPLAQCLYLPLLLSLFHECSLLTMSLSLTLSAFNSPSLYIYPHIPLFLTLAALFALRTFKKYR